MIVRVFRSGTSRGEAPVHYLLSSKDHAGQPRAVPPEVLAGHPATTISVINAITRKHRYVSGVLAFRDGEVPTRAQMHEVIGQFKRAVAPGLKDEQFNSLFVLHRDKGNTEIHFVVPMVEFASGRGKRLNVHPPGPRNLALYEAFTAVTNHRLDYAQVSADPLRVAVSPTDRKVASSKGKHRNAHLLQQEIVRAVQAGQVNNRNELVQWLDNNLGVTVTRQGRDYLSVKMPGAQKAMRLKGPLFQADTDYRSLALLKSGKAGTVMLTVPEYQQALDRLDTLVAERRAFNVKTYLTPEGSRGKPKAGHVPTPSRPPITRTTTKEKPMRHAAIKAIITEALTTLRHTHAEKASAANVIQLPGKQAIGQRIAEQRERSTAAADAPSLALEQLNELLAAIGNLQTSVDAATADVANAKTPEARKQAEQRLARLRIQMMRLNQQLQMARQRQLNEGGRTKLKL